MIGLLAVGIPAAAVLFALLYRRPQNGLLLVAALTPLHGLLTILPGGPSLTGWKEGVLVLTLLATFVTPNRDRTMPPSMPWWPAAVAWVAIGTLSALLMSGPAAVTALKITYFYLIIPIILWRTPFDARDRDRLVTILMGTTAFGAVVGWSSRWAVGTGLGVPAAFVSATAGNAMNPTGNLVQQLGVSEQTYARWRKQFAGMDGDEARRLKELEIENARLKRLVAEQAIDLSILREANDYLGKHRAPRAGGAS